MVGLRQRSNDRLALAGEFPIDLSGGVETWFKSHGKKENAETTLFPTVKSNFLAVSGKKNCS
jgi:hypothetical protein